MSQFPAPWGNYLVEDLAPIAEPEIVSAWPQTVGWQAIAVILVIYSIRKLYLIWRAYQRNAYRREALAWLQALPAYSDLQQQNIYRQLPALLRKTALYAFGREVVSPLSQQQWEQWLDQQCTGCDFSEQFSSQLHALAYAPAPDFSTTQMRALQNHIGLWIKQHRRLDD